MISWLALFSLLPLVFSLPLEHRARTACGKFDTIPSGSYSLLTNHWGKTAAISGWQCSTLESVHDHNVTWSTQWTWPDDHGVKSFSNIQLNDGINKQLSAISSIPSVWHWSQHGTGVVANVAYDLFTSYSPAGSNANEVMVWLANFNAAPISYEVDETGQAVPIASSLDIAGHSWNFHVGYNGYNVVYSFLPVNDHITSFHGDIYEFFTYLIHNGYISSLEYLVTAQAGTEATSGSTTLKTSSYQMSIN